MKDLFKTIFIFIALVVSFCFAQQETFSCNVPQTNYIQNDYQKIVLISNSMYGGETLSNPKSSDYNSLGNNTHIVLNIQENNTLQKARPEFVKEYIYNPSTSHKTEISIRAP